MAEIRIDDPELYATKEVDSSGRIYLGKDFAGKKVRVVIESVEEDAEE